MQERSLADARKRAVTGALAGTVLAGVLVALPARAETPPGTWNGLSDRFQIDTGYFRLNAKTVLRFQGPQGGGGDVNLEGDLGVPDKVNTFWVDATWRVGRRHQLKLGFTRMSRDRNSHTLERDFTWGGETYTAGMTTNTTTAADVLGGYYRFAVYRNDRFEIGPTVGVGYLWLNATIRATGTVTTPGGSESRTLERGATTGSITGAVGAYAEGWLAKRLLVIGDFLYIKVNPGDSTASDTDWRAAAYYYFTRNVGVGVEYKYNEYRYDRGIVASELGGDLTLKGFQVMASFRF